MARVIIHAKQLPMQFWAEALNTASHIHNRVILHPGTTTTSYELWKGRKPNVKYFHIFGSTCFILNDRDHHRKWDSKSDRGIFLGYSANSRAYRVYNQHLKTVMESINALLMTLVRNPIEILMMKIRFSGIPFLINLLRESQNRRPALMKQHTYPLITIQTELIGQHLLHQPFTLTHMKVKQQYLQVSIL
ncbi:putative gag-pol polyprotein [Cucumis melo var. makuwa]|uniref:Gag-pol polyprotein n=1 Tax=Cucumis melo var. makuwa TaxID=1194695 RepID=A0A5A7SL27_CUCMM|nr:putative gag-pol polyprotein [Cucumis melo var. makuwa]TYK07487.1 putative gag-pol polyprotein [Cucumis melo var. makuwa]